MVYFALHDKAHSLNQTLILPSLFHWLDTQVYVPVVLSIYLAVDVDMQ